MSSPAAKSAAEAEERLLANAVQEEGVIIALNKGFGFLKSNKRHEHVYFHFSNFAEATQNQTILRKGQEVKFWVVTEETGKEGQAHQDYVTLGICY